MANALVIPCHIRTKWDLKCLVRLLDSVRDQTALFSRVYVVDDASPLKYSLADHDVEHVVLRTNGGPARARNIAVTKALAADHELLFFTDHDCILDRDWHGHMARFLSDTEFAAVGGVKGNELIYMITNACNDRCPKCAIWERPEPKNQHLDVAYFLRCLERLHHNLYQVTLTGGEPLLFKRDVVKIADEAHRLGVPMVMVTNGRGLDEAFLTRYQQQGHVLVISVDSVIREKWNEFRGTQTFDIVMPKIELALRILGDQLRIQSVLSKESQDEVPKVVAWCKERGIRHNVQLYQDFGANNWTYAVEPAQMAADGVPCAARKNICIYPNGDVVKCFDHRRIPIAREPLGNIARQDILEILCTRRSTEVSRVMRDCNFPCKQMSCNKPQAALFQ